MTDTPTTASVASDIQAAKSKIKSKMATEVFPPVEMAVPEAVRAMAERSMTQTRDGYEKAKAALEESVEVLERSLDAAGKGAATLNRKVIDIAQQNLNSGFDFARSIATARNIAEVLELQGSYMRKQFEALAAQAADVRDLSSRVASDTTEPLKSHVTSTMDKLKLH